MAVKKILYVQKHGISPPLLTVMQTTIVQLCEFGVKCTVFSFLPSQIVTDRGNSKQKIRGLGPTPREGTFQHKRLGEITVEEYYDTENRVRLRYPNFPCLDCSKGRKKIYVPPECAT